MKLGRLLLVLISLCAVSAANESETVLKLGDTFFRDSLHTMALSQYEQYVNGSPDPANLPRVYYRMGKIYREMSRDSDALDWYERLMQRFPTDPHVKRAHFESGLVYKNRKQWLEAAGEFYQVWHVYPLSAEAEEALFNAAYSYGVGGDFRRAIELYQRYVGKFSSNKKAGEAASNAVLLLIEQKEFTEARELLEKLNQVAYNENWKAELSYLGALIALETNSEESVETVLKSIISGKNEFRSRSKTVSLLADILADKQQYTEAWNYFDSYKKEQSGELTLEDKMRWADIAFFAKQNDACTQLYKDALSDTAANNDLIIYLLARNYDAQGDFYSSLNSLRSVVESDSLKLAQAAQLKIAELYYKNGIYANAVQEYRNYLSRGGDKNDMVLYRIGKIYQEKLSASEMAIREYDKLLKWHANSRFVGKASLAMAQIYESQNKFEEAFQMYQYIATLEGNSDLGMTASKRSEYLKMYKIPHAVSAISALTELSLTEELSAGEKRVKGAEIYRSFLKERYRAIDLLTPLLKNETATDSIRGTALRLLALNWKELSYQFEEEGKEKESTYGKAQAVTYFNSILEDSLLVQLHNEARFELVGLSNEGIEGYETYVASYANSPFAGEAYLKIAELYTGNRDRESISKAAAAYQKAFEVGVHEIKKEALTGSILSFLEIEDMKSAEKVINLYKSEYSSDLKSETFSWITARYSHQAKQWSEAEKRYRYIVATFPQGKYSARSRLYLADVELAQKKYGEAFNDYTLAHSLFSDGFFKAEATVGRLEAMVLQGRAEEALEQIAEVGTPQWLNDEQNSMVLFLAGKAYESLNVSYDALKQYAGVLKNKSFSRRNEALRSSAELNYELRKYSEASGAYDILKATGSDSVYYEMKYITSSILSGKGAVVASNIKEFKKGAGKNDPKAMHEIYFAEGLYFYRQKEYDKADKRFSFIVNKGGNTELADDAAYYRGMIKYDQKKWDDALELMNGFVAKFPTSPMMPSGLYTIAMIYHHTEKFPEAAKQYETVVAAKGVDQELMFRALVNGAVVWQKLSAWESAALMSEKVLKEFGDRIDSSSYALKTGFAFLKGNRVKHALHYFELAERDPREEDKPEISYWIAMSNLRLGKDEKALERFLKISYLYGNSGKWGVTADFESARIYEQRGEFPKALSLYRKIVRIEGENSPLGGDAKERITALETLMEEF